MPNLPEHPPSGAEIDALFKGNAWQWMLAYFQSCRQVALESIEDLNTIADPTLVIEAQVQARTFRSFTEGDLEQDFREFLNSQKVTRHRSHAGKPGRTRRA